MNKKKRAEFGDFQTPASLSDEICRFLWEDCDVDPLSFIEPTCGEGNFAVSAINTFKNLEAGLCIDINEGYVEKTKQRLSKTINRSAIIDVRQGDFFRFDWENCIVHFTEPILVIGNPPWVTNASQGVLNSDNLPNKTNIKNHVGLDALTGKSNFDISEWMLIKIFEWFRNKIGWIAMLCKTTVARKLLKHSEKSSIPLSGCNMYLIDTKRYFGATVDACLFVGKFNGEPCNYDCKVYDGIENKSFLKTIGIKNGHIIANIHYYEKWRHLLGDPILKWRSGVKHNCAKVMELTRIGADLQNGLGETVEIESDYLYPLLKSSDIANRNNNYREKYVLITQQKVGDDTSQIKERTPKTWEYLTSHKRFFDNRKSSIYEGKPPFSIFGIGDYSFLPWKVVISGLYKFLNFRVIGPQNGKPTMLDDTCYFLSFRIEEEAKVVASLLCSEEAHEFFQAFIFWDAKRPITASILNKLNIVNLAFHYHKEKELRNIYSQPRLL